MTFLPNENKCYCKKRNNIFVYIIIVSCCRAPSLPAWLFMYSNTVFTQTQICTNLDFKKRFCVKLLLLIVTKSLQISIINNRNWWQLLWHRGELTFNFTGLYVNVHFVTKWSGNNIKKMFKILPLVFLWWFKRWILLKIQNDWHFSTVVVLVVLSGQMSSRCSSERRGWS